MKKIFIVSILAISSGCVSIGPGAPNNPGVKGVLLLNGIPKENTKVNYAEYSSDNCKDYFGSFGSDITDSQGHFFIPVEKGVKTVSFMPMGCIYAGQLCFPNNRSWKFSVNGIGDISYESNHVVDFLMDVSKEVWIAQKGLVVIPNGMLDAPKMLLVTPEGECEFPNVITVECDLGIATGAICKIIE